MGKAPGNDTVLAVILEITICRKIFILGTPTTTGSVFAKKFPTQGSEFLATL
jgi:hypothetical protein